MNYLAEINRFYDWLETNSLPKSAIALWNALMHTNNRADWKTEFAVAISVLELKTGFKRSELFKARNILIQKERIKCNSRAGNNSAVYQIIPFCVHNTDASADANAKKTEKTKICVHNTDASADTSADTSADANGDYKINYTKLNKTFFSKKDKQQVVYPKKNENDFSEKIFSEQNQVTNQESFTKSVNSEEEKRKKVAPKKEKRFFDDVYTLASESTENVAGSFVNQPTESRSVCFEKTENANKSVLNDDFYSSEVNVPQKKKSLLKQKETTSKFIPPSVSEVAEYCQERNNDVLPEKFVDFYTGKGWMIGKNKMKDWRACVRTWEKNNKNQNNQYKKTYVKKEENIEPTIGRMKLSDVKKMMTGWD